MCRWTTLSEVHERIVIKIIASPRLHIRLYIFISYPGFMTRIDLVWVTCCVTRNSEMS